MLLLLLSWKLSSYVIGSFTYGQHDSGSQEAMVVYDAEFKQQFDQWATAKYATTPLSASRQIDSI